MKLSLGTAQFGLNYGITNNIGKIKNNEIKKILFLANQNGINSFDTAQDYGDSEKIIGQYRKERGFKITTKLSNNGIESFNESSIDLWDHKLKLSLKNLKTDKIENLLIHNPSDLQKPGNIFLKDWLKKIKHSNLVENIGLSIYSNYDLRNVEREILDVVQLPLSLYNQKLLTDGTLKNLKKLGCEIQVRSIFLQGLLISSLKDWPKGINNKLKYHHVKLENFIEKEQISLIDIALDFVKKIPYIDKIIVGISSSLDLQEILDSYNKEISLSFQELKKWNYIDYEHLDPRYWNK